MDLVYGIVILFAPVLITNIIVFNKLVFRIKKWRLNVDSVDKKDFRIEIAIYLLLLICLVFLLFFSANFVFFPKSQLMPMPFVILGKILCLLFFVPIIILFAMTTKFSWIL